MSSQPVEFMDFLLQIVNENKNSTDKQKQDVKALVDESKRLYQENEDKFKRLNEKLQNESNDKAAVLTVEKQEDQKQIDGEFSDLISHRIVEL